MDLHLHHHRHRHRCHHQVCKFLRKEALVVEGILVPVTCLENQQEPCPHMASCRTFPLWEGLDKVISDYLDQYTIADLMEKGEPGYDYVI